MGLFVLLDHVLLYDPMEGRPVEVALARQKDEVVHRLRRLIGEELDADRALLRAKGRVVVLVGEIVISGGLL